MKNKHEYQYEEYKICEDEQYKLLDKLMEDCEDEQDLMGSLVGMFGNYG